MKYGGKVYKPGQGNNAYIFPGIALGVIATGVHHITEDLFLISAQAVADHVKDEDLEVGSLYPPLGTIRECSIDIAVRIANYAYARSKYFYLNLIHIKEMLIQAVLKLFTASRRICSNIKLSNVTLTICLMLFLTLAGLASEYPEPKDKRQFIVSKMYDANYDSPLPNVYDWPGDYAKPRVLPDK